MDAGKPLIRYRLREMRNLSAGTSRKQRSKNLLSKDWEFLLTEQEEALVLRRWGPDRGPVVSVRLVS